MKALLLNDIGLTPSNFKLLYIHFEFQTLVNDVVINIQLIPIKRPRLLSAYSRCDADRMTFPREIGLDITSLRTSCPSRIKQLNYIVR